MQEPHTQGAGQTSPGGYPLVASKIVVPGDQGTKVVEELAVHVTPGTAYQFWKDWNCVVQLLPATWRAKVLTPVETLLSAPGPGEEEWQWTHSVINDERGELLAFRSSEQAPVPYAGTVRFTGPSAGAGCTIRIQLDYLHGPEGDAGISPGRDTVAAAVRDALMRCKRALEAPGTRPLPANG